MSLPTSGEMPNCENCTFTPSSYQPTDEERQALDKLMLLVAAIEKHGAEEAYEMTPVSADDEELLRNFRNGSQEKKLFSQNVSTRGKTIAMGWCAIWGYDPKTNEFFSRADHQRLNHAE